MRDSINNQATKKASIKSQFKYEYEKKAAADSVKVAEEKKVLAAQMKQEKTQRYALYAGLALVLVFAGFMFNRFRVTQKQKRIIEAKEKETQVQNTIITQQKYLVEEKHKEITESVDYAERIQQGFLVTKEFLNAHLKTEFVVFKPKDKVSGDFYWAEELNEDTVIVCVADSTGHGIPGAFMSLLNMSLLNEAVLSKHYTNTADILNFVRRVLTLGIKPNAKGEGGNDGMDCALFSINYNTLELEFTGANNGLWIVRDNQLIEIKGEKMPCGRSLKADIPFTSQVVQLQKGDSIYASTDGFPDQFGGEKGKKFMSKNLKELLLTNSHLPMDDQKQLLETTFLNWVGQLEQVDDVTIMGIKI
jgi:serine phosphatase RsbU (regulator of sigma subunit)